MFKSLFRSVVKSIIIAVITTIITFIQKEFGKPDVDESEVPDVATA